MIESLRKSVEEKFKDKKERLEHVVGVYETALKLAHIHSADLNKVGIAALYHDYAKYDVIDDQVKEISNVIRDKYKETPIIYHAYASAQALKENFNIKDEEILNAIRHHVWGRKKMSLIEKIVFVSDTCEPNRNFKDAPGIYELATKDINQAVEKCMEASIKYLKTKKLTPSKEQVSIYKYYKELNCGKK